MYFCIPWGILANVKISHLSAFSSWLCDLFPSCVALGLRPRATHEGNKSHNPSLQADNPYITTEFHCAKRDSRFLAWSVIREVCLPLRKKYLDLFNVQTNIIYTCWKDFWRAKALIFPRKFRHCFWRSKYDLIYHRRIFGALNIPFESEQKQKFQITKSPPVLHAKRKYSLTLDNFSLSSQQLIPN